MHVRNYGKLWMNPENKPVLYFDEELSFGD